MPIRQSQRDRGIARGRALVAELGRTAEQARLEHGLSYADLGREMRLAAGQVARLCRGQSPHASVLRIAELFAVLGMDLSARGFPVGHSVRDRAQLSVLGRFRRQLSGALGWRQEVPVVELPNPGTIDLRAWDAAIDGAGWTARVEAETHVRDLQALQRRIALKQRDGSITSVVLLLADTRHHRRLLGEEGSVLREQFPVSARTAMRALRDGDDPGGNAIVLV